MLCFTDIVSFLLRLCSTNNMLCLVLCSRSITKIIICFDSLFVCLIYEKFFLISKIRPFDFGDDFLISKICSFNF